MSAPAERSAKANTYFYCKLVWTTVFSIHSKQNGIHALKLKLTRVEMTNMSGMCFRLKTNRQTRVECGFDSKQNGKQVMKLLSTQNKMEIMRWNRFRLESKLKTTLETRFDWSRNENWQLNAISIRVEMFYNGSYCLQKILPAVKREVFNKAKILWGLPMQ